MKNTHKQFSSTRVTYFLFFLAFCFFADFGVEEITLLAGHFSKVLETAGVTPDAVEQEWGLLKAQLYRKAKWQDLTWTQIHGLYTSTCPNVLHLMDLLMTIPVANAECDEERIQNPHQDTSIDRHTEDPDVIPRCYRVRPSGGC